MDSGLIVQNYSLFVIVCFYLMPSSSFSCFFINNNYISANCVTHYKIRHNVIRLKKN
jgi:hypothetical protein